MTNDNDMLYEYPPIRCACPPEVEALLSECYLWERKECGALADAVQPRRGGLCDGCDGSGMSPAAAAVLVLASEPTSKEIS